MSDVRGTILNNDDATHMLRVSKAERRLDGLTMGGQGSSRDHRAHARDLLWASISNAESPLSSPFEAPQRNSFSHEDLHSSTTLPFGCRFILE